MKQAKRTKFVMRRTAIIEFTLQVASTQIIRDGQMAAYRAAPMNTKTKIARHIRERGFRRGRVAVMEIKTKTLETSERKTRKPQI